MDVVETSWQALLAAFPNGWPERLNTLSFSESAQAELEPRFEANWLKQANAHLGLDPEGLAALIDLASAVWQDDLLRRYALVTSHFLFNTGDAELRAFTWPEDHPLLCSLEHGGLFYLLCYITYIDAALQVYREQRIPLDLFSKTVGGLRKGIETTADGNLRFTNLEYLIWLCEGKVISINGLTYLPGIWKDQYSIWRNGLSGELREEAITEGAAADQLSLAMAAKARGLDINLWQLKLKPRDKVMQVLAIDLSLQVADIRHSMAQADRFFKDSDHFYNFVAFDFRCCEAAHPLWQQTVVLREEL